MPTRKIKANRISNRRTLYFICLVILLVASVMLPVLLKMNTEVQYKSIYSGYTAGQISDKNVYAKTSIDLIDSDATAEKRAAARQAVLPVFSYSTTKTAEMISNVDNLRKALQTSDYATIVSIVGDDLAKQVAYLSNTKLLAVAYDLITEIVDMGYYSSSDLDAISSQGYSALTLSNYYKNASTHYEDVVDLNQTNVLTSANINAYLSSRLMSFGVELTANEAILLQNLILTMVQPNILYDSALTTQRRDNAEFTVDTVVISVVKGQILIEQDHVVTHEQVELLRLLSTQSNTFSFFEFVGHLIFNSIILAVGLYVFGMFAGRSNLHYVQYHILLVAGFLISLIATYFLTLVSSKLNLQFSDSFLPVFFLSLFMTEISGYKRLGFVSVFMLAAVMATLPTASIMTFFYCITCGSACVFLIRFFNRRLDMIYQWFFTCITCAGITILFMLINEASFNSIFIVLLGTLMNVSIAYILLGTLLPLAEKVFNLPTIFRLYELAYGESALLTRLSQSAPGTYSHSLAVADLAEAGARAIGANPLLARVGGLYHDIGKIEHPEYFIENQSGVNKHDDISPSLSVAVIKSHVKVGADKGRENGLPIEIIKIISSHHGNDIIQYFYHEALKSQAAAADNKGDTVNASDYSYNAEIPDFRECGIVMLADSIEAASRTVAPNATKYAKLIDSIFLGKIERGQLDDSNLTMNDIKTLSDSFVKALVARNHSRIEYPDADED
ncbi:MAG: HDIG domain-containing protein [Sphaerochaetaceae bacterium]|nr:HDIG domain-containing protein [Sphaerochaetaceae bacterium]